MVRVSAPRNHPPLSPSPRPPAVCQLLQYSTLPPWPLSHSFRSLSQDLTPLYLPHLPLPLYPPRPPCPSLVLCPVVCRAVPCRTDKWAEKDSGTKWGDKWEERFSGGIGTRRGRPGTWLCRGEVSVDTPLLDCLDVYIPKDSSMIFHDAVAMSGEVSAARPTVFMKDSTWSFQGYAYSHCGCTAPSPVGSTLKSVV